MKGKMSTFQQMIATLLAIMLPILAIGAALAAYSYRSLLTQISQGELDRMANGLNRMEADVKRIQMRQMELVYNVETNRVAYMFSAFNSFEQGQIVSRIQDKLASIQDGSEMLREARLAIKPLGWTINAKGSSGGSYRDDDGAYFDVLAGLLGDSTACVVWNDQTSRVLTTSQALRNHVIAEAEIDTGSLLRRLTAGMSNVDGAKYLLLGGSLELSDIVDADLMERARAFGLGVPRNVWTEIGGWAVFGVTSDQLGVTLIQVAPRGEMYRFANMLTVLVAMFVAALLICVAIYYVVLQRVIRRPLRELLTGFRQIERGEFGAKLPEHGTGDFAPLYGGFNAMSENLKTLVDQAYNQKILLQRSEMKQLQAQINPHFLYNSFLLLSRMIKVGDNAHALNMAKELGAYFRYVTRGGMDIVPLKDEWRHAGIYAGIQLMRFGNRIQMDFSELPESLESRMVPRLILQPIIENAFDHSLENKTEGGFLRVSAEQRDDELILRIEDNGDELSGELLERLQTLLRDADGPAGRETTALLNIHRRIQIFSEGRGGLQLERSELGGLCVLIVLR